METKELISLLRAAADELEKQSQLPPAQEIIDSIGYVPQGIVNQDEADIWKRGFMACYNTLKRWRQ